MWKFVKQMGIPDHLTCLWENCMQIRKQQLEQDMEQHAGSKSGKEYVKAVYCHPAYLTYMQSTSCEMPDWMKHKLESRLREKYRWPQIGRWRHLYGRKQRGTKEPLDEAERGEWKSWLKTQHSENEDHGIWSHHFMANRWGNNGSSDRLFILGGSRSLQIVTAAMKLKNVCSLEEKLWQTQTVYLQNRGITLPTKVRLVKAMVFQ